MKVLAFDFGASSGRAILGILEDGKLSLKELYRFDNDPVSMNGGFYWDLPRLFHEIKQGLLKAKGEEFESIGIDTWGVDYGLLTEDGTLLGNPVHYRDSRTEHTPEAVAKILSDKELYQMSGIQKMNFNTLFQLYQTKTEQEWLYQLADKFIFIPDLFGYLLTGKVYAEQSIASTSQLLDPYTKEWNWKLIDLLGFKRSMFPEVVPPGAKVGTLREALCEELGIAQKSVTAVCGHDTACAVAAVPAEEQDFVYISCGTWSLFGTELKQPCITEDSARYNITNEGGYDGTTRFLKNIIGLWMIQETRRQFRRDGKEYTYAEMEQLARAAKPFACFIDPDDPRFAPPGNQIQRIKDFCKETNQYVPQTDGEVIRCIYESLAMKYKYTFEQLKKCTGKDFKTIHMVGGGTKDGFLCEMTADATCVPVIAGPTEATAAGNVCVQLMALGAIQDLQEARRVIARSLEVKSYQPQSGEFEEHYPRFMEIVQD